MTKLPHLTFRSVPQVVLAFLLCGFSCMPLRGQEVVDDLAKHPLLKHLIGEWTAEGELTAQDGNVITIRQEWKGTVLSPDTFAIEGKREINGNGEKTDYKWTIIHNKAAGSYEAMHDPGNGGAVQRFEGSLSELTKVLEWVSRGDGGSSIKLVDAFVGEGHDTFETEVTFTNDKGETTLSGKITNRKVKKG